MIGSPSHDVLAADLMATAANDHLSAGSAAATATVPVLVAVESPPVREALVAMIGALDRFRVVGEASNGDETLALARRLRPQLALVGQDLAGCCGSWTIKSMRSEGLVQAVVSIGLRGDERTRARALAAGAQAYVQMGADPGELVTAIEVALRTAAVTPPTVSSTANGNGHYPSNGVDAALGGLSLHAF